MDIFVPFPVDSDQSIHQRMSSALGTIKTSTGEVRDYVDLFNHDVEALNNLLNHPHSVYAYHEEALKWQNEYNAALADSKSRWDSENKRLDIGKSVLKNLSEHKKRFQYAVSKMEAVKQKSEQLMDMLPHNSWDGSFWSSIEKLAAKLDKKDQDNYLDTLFSAAESLDELSGGKRFNLLNKLVGDLDNLTQDGVQNLATQKEDSQNKQYTKLLEELDGVISKRRERLQNLKLDWQSQDIFVLANAEDLLKMRTDLNNFKQFLGFIEKGVQSDAKRPADQKIQQVISYNKNRLQKLEIALIQAMSWRILAASQKKDLRFDDSRYALINEIRTLIFLYDDAQALQPIFNLITISPQSLSVGMNFKSFELLTQALKESGDQYALNKWKFSKWVKDADNENAIPVERRGLNIIPKSLAEFISEKPGRSLGSWTRYYYFQTTKITNDLFGWLRKKFLGPHSEFLTLFNETMYQAKKFSETIDKAKVERKSLNLYLLSQSSAFKNALTISSYIKKERKKGRSLKPSWTIGVLLKWMPFLNRFRTYQFFDIWRSMIDTALVGYRANCRNIADKIIQDFEGSLFDSIKKKVFLLPFNLLVDIQHFVAEYGDPEMVAKFSKMTQPLNIMKRFKFLHPPNDNENDRGLNEDSVHAFLSFAKKYWTIEEYGAAEEMAKIILREKVPASDKDLTKLFNKTKVFYTGTHKEVEFMYFLKYIAHEYVFLTGDQGDNDSLTFLERFYPNAANNWRSDRMENLDDKFVFIHAILDVQPNFEREIDLNATYDVGQRLLKYRRIGKYIQDLNVMENSQSTHIKILCEKASNYVKFYQGGNDNYKDIILSLGQVQPLLIQQYLGARFQWLLSHTDYKFDEDEKDFYLKSCKTKVVQDVLCKMINSHFDGKSEHVDTLIQHIDNPEIKGVFLAKRLQYLMKKNSYEDIIATELFDDISDNYVFVNCMDGYFDQVIQRAIQRNNFKTLEKDGFAHMIERFGSLVNKEAYRILRLKRLLAINDYERIQVYVNSLLPYIKSLDKDFITLDKGKKLLVSMYEEYVEGLEISNEWHAHIQYLLEYFSMGLCPELLHKVRTLWLHKYLFEPEKFSELASMTRPTLDLKFHQDNKMVPSEKVNLKKFYGTEISAVADLVDARLNQYTVSISDNMIQLLNRYLKDPELKVLDKHHLYKKKMEDFQRARDIILALKQKNYGLMFDLLDHFIEDYSGQKRLLDSERTDSRQAVVAYQSNILTSIYGVFLEHMKTVFLSSVQLPADKLKTHRQSFENIMQRIHRSRLPDPLKAGTLFLNKKNQTAYNLLHKIQNNLVIDKLHLLKIDGDEALLLRRYLAQTVKSDLMGRMGLIMSILSETDPLYVVLNTFGEILTAKQLNKLAVEQKTSVLSAFENKQNRFDRKVEKMTNNIIAKLEKGETIRKMTLFSDKKSSLQITFLQVLPAKAREALQNAVFKRIEKIVDAPMPEDGLQTLREWECYSLLCQWLSSFNKMKNKFRQSVTPLVAQKLIEAKAHFAVLEITMDQVLKGGIEKMETPQWGSYIPGLRKKMNQSLELNEDRLEEERALLKLAMFTRLFGNDEQKDELDHLLQGVLMRLRRAMMDGQLDPFRQHCIKFAEKLVTLAGNQFQSEQCANLMNLWNKFTTHDGMSLDALKSLALKDTLPAFLKKFDNDLFNYFTDKYHLSEEFSKMLDGKLKQWPYNKGKINFADVSKKYSLQEFKEWMKQYQIPPKLFYFGGNIDDKAAKKLYIAFCLSLQAHEIAWILQGRIAANQLQGFSVKLFTDVLMEFNEKAMDELNFKSHSLEKHFREILGIDQEYFVSWDLDSNNSQSQKPDDKVAKTSKVKKALVH